MTKVHDERSPLDRLPEVSAKANGSRPPPCGMSDAELLRFGMVAKWMCSEAVAVADRQREVFALQLREARKEWKKRFPRLPLSSAFDENVSQHSSARLRLMPQRTRLPD